MACSDWFGGVGAAIVMWYRFREKVCKEVGVLLSSGCVCRM